MTTFPPFVCDEIKRVFKGVPAEALRALAAAEPALQAGGFRATNVAPLRLRAAQAACSRNMPAGVRRLLARHAPDAALVARLSTGTLVAQCDALATFLGGARFVLACWLDDRAEVRAVAEEWMARTPVFEALEAGAAVARLREWLGGLPGVFGTEAGGAGGEQERRALKEELGRLREDNRRLRGVEDRVARLRERAEKAEAALAGALQAKKALEADVRRTTREREEAREEVARERKHRELRLLALHEAGMAGAFEGWLDHARAVEQEAGAPYEGGEELLQRAEAAVREQAGAERHSGNRAVLAERLERIRTAQARVAEALRNAVRPLPGLVAVAGELEEEAQRLERVLEVAVPESALEHALAMRAHGVDDAELYRLAVLVDRLEELGGLDGAASARLRGVLARRQALLQATAGDPEAVETGTEASALLRRALTGRKGVFLLVDGHNVFFALQGKYAPAGAVVPDREKRARFVSDVVRVVRPRPTCRTWIVFDGPVRNEASPAANVRVVYSGGAGEHRADGVLVENIRFFRGAEPEVPVILVSNDNALRGEVRKLGGWVMTAAEFGSFL